MDLNTLRDAILRGLPRKTRWFPHDPDCLDFAFPGYIRPVNELGPGLQGRGPWPNLFAFGEYDFADGGAAYGWICIREKDGAILDFGPARKDAIRIMNSSLDAFIRTFCILDRIRSQPNQDCDDMMALLRKTDPDAPADAVWL